MRMRQRDRQMAEDWLQAELAEWRADTTEKAVRAAVAVCWPDLLRRWGSIGNTLKAMSYDTRSCPGTDWIGQQFEHEIRHQFRQLAKGG